MANNISLRPTVSTANATPTDTVTPTQPGRASTTLPPGTIDVLEPARRVGGLVRRVEDRITTTAAAVEERVITPAQRSQLSQAIEELKASSYQLGSAAL